MKTDLTEARVQVCGTDIEVSSWPAWVLFHSKHVVHLYLCVS
jgi:hypothetical protein